MAARTKAEEKMDVDNAKAATEDTGGNLAPGEVVGESEGAVEVKSADDVGNGETRTKRQIKKDDSGISVEKSENSSDDDASKKPKTANFQVQEVGGCSFNGSGFLPKLKSRFKNRNYRTKKGRGIGKGSSDEDETTIVESQQSSQTAGDGRSSPDSGHQESSSAPDDVEVEESGKESADVETSGVDNTRKRSRASESDESDSAGSEERKTELSDTELEEEEITPNVLLKQKPKHKWFVVQEVINRQKGVGGRYQGAELFQQRCYGSLHAVQRLELMYKLEAHRGCVNTLHFNSSGSLLASGSDDLSIVVWDWAVGKFLVSYDSGHRSNVFQAKFLPLTGDTHIVSCGRDGQVRLGELSSTGACRATRRLGQHRGPAHKLAIQQETPHVFLSSGEDGLIMSIDVRDSKADKLLYVRDGDRKIALYSIHMNPLNCNEFCVSGRDNYVRIYDKRKLSDGTQLKKFCPRHLTNPGTFTYVTCAVFNYNGTEILGSYNDEDIYLFDTSHPDGSDFVHRFEGHRNNDTVKGISFFGPKSEYIVSGSDCGNIYFWDKGTESIVQWLLGDENGVVNCLEPHPQIPILATSGLDDDVKIWVPSCEHEPTMVGLRSTVVSNYKGREDDRHRDPDAFDGQMLWLLWRHIRRTERRRELQNQNSPSWSFGTAAFSHVSHGSSDGGLRTSASAPDEDTATSEGSSSDSEDREQRVRCSPS